jgi:hypothetical protein
LWEFSWLGFGRSLGEGGRLVAGGGKVLLGEFGAGVQGDAPKASVAG